MARDTSKRPSLNESRKLIHELGAEARLSLVMKGDEIAKQEKYPNSLKGLDAIEFYLFEKRGMDPARVRIMHHEAIEFLLSKEMAGWVRPTAHRIVKAPSPAADPKDRYEVTLGLFLAQAELAHFAELYGDFLARQEGYSENGREALEVHLCRKFGYRPDEVVSWSWETIRLLLAPEMKDWNPSPEKTAGGSGKPSPSKTRRKSPTTKSALVD